MMVDPIANVVVAHVRSSGLALRYGDERFWLDSVGALTASQVRDRDSRGHLLWASDDMHAWFVRNFGDGQIVRPIPQPGGRGAGIGLLLDTLRTVRVTRRQALVASAGLLLLTLLLPPWIAYRAPLDGYAGSGGGWGSSGREPDPGFVRSIGWHFILSTPTDDDGGSTAIDWSLIALEVLVLGVATGLVLYVLPPTRGTEHI